MGSRSAAPCDSQACRDRAGGFVVLSGLPADAPRVCLPGSGFCLLPIPAPGPFRDQTKSCFANRFLSLPLVPSSQLKSSPRGQGQLRKGRADGERHARLRYQSSFH